ncbi:hypothetical protein [Luteithermobacter gelatinilyticus]|uniref:hypothetical protein n=1 Tax=Luteithermobacter gelatinilyticus TaxID=2582913 RepID=UPI001105D518|nr:hypothetical protein [Luteithermobacter gelatinilyticus]
MDEKILLALKKNLPKDLDLDRLLGTHPTEWPLMDRKRCWVWSGPFWNGHPRLNAGGKAYQSIPRLLHQHYGDKLYSRQRLYRRCYTHGCINPIHHLRTKFPKPSLEIVIEYLNGLYPLHLNNLKELYIMNPFYPREYYIAALKTGKFPIWESLK